MPVCIYCGSEEVSKEHHLPRCFGNFKGYVVLDDRVCNQCNGLCGQLDEQLCNSGGESFFRQFLGITGRKSHEKINPFYRGSAGGGRLQMEGRNRETGDTAQLELVPGGKARELRCVRLTADDDSIHVIPILGGMTPQDFRKAFDRLGIKHFKEAQVWADKEEIPWVETLLATLKIQGKTEWSQRSQGPITYGPLDIKFTVTSRYFRDIAKIGFHYFLTRVGGFRGDEPCFSRLRNFIMTDCRIDECKPFVTRNSSQIIDQLQAGARLKAWGHL